ncbi:hypothetical protein HPB48_016554 [Haemaphysalis longicornis]|uniref:Uncharacterized protein n=1 Tax=Haemaphysalis longicornis TaxID=44386 RepID=A0A9J6GSN9_HAELO|nr:hypothetical protein HPB48_016554 [Haemaphysalis longicornis]
MDRHKRNRATLRAGMTKTISDSNALLDSQTASIAELQDLLNVLVMKESALRDIDKQIEDTVDEQNLEQEWEAAEGYYVLICVAKSKLSRRIEEIQRPQVSNSPMNNVEPSNAARVHSSASIKLPRMELGKFDGTIQGWRFFWDQYEDHTPELAAVDH